LKSTVHVSLSKISLIYAVRLQFAREVGELAAQNTKKAVVSTRMIFINV